MIEIKDTRVYAHKQYVGFVLNGVLMLEKSLSEADIRKVRELTELTAVVKAGEIKQL